jgi:hypothetical protein
VSDPGSAVPRAIAPGVIEIDTLLGGWQRVTAGYLIEGPAPVLVETGSQSSVPVTLMAGTLNRSSEAGRYFSTSSIVSRSCAPFRFTSSPRPGA